MTFSRFVIAALFVAGTMQTAAALQIDETAGKGDASRFSDPDNQIPFPHLDDNGQPSANFQSQPIGNSGASFNLTGPNSEPGAFERAQQRMQQ
jgi:hypothetical protein